MSSFRHLGDEAVHHGYLWHVVVADFEAPDGERFRRDIVRSPGSVGVVPLVFDAEGVASVVLVRQYRHPVRDWTLEVPAGSVNDGERPLAAAQRELAEEVGGSGGAWRHLTTFFSSSAHLSLRSDAFLATGVEVGPPRPDAEEELTVVRLPVAEALERARRGQVVEGQTALCLRLAAVHLDGARSS